MPFDLSMKGRNQERKSEFFIYEVVIESIEIGADRMKNFVRLLIVALMLVGLSGVVSAEKFSFTKPIPVSFQVPEGYKLRPLQWTESDNALNQWHAIENTSLVIYLDVEPLLEEDLDQYPGGYVFDDLSKGEEEKIVKQHTEYLPTGNSVNFITLKNGHRALMIAERWGLQFGSGNDVFTVMAGHSGYKITLKVKDQDAGKNPQIPISSDNKKLAYQILMSLDF